MLQTVNGLVLKQQRLPNEGSKRLSILTDNGIIEAFINGTNRKNSGLQSAAQPLCYSQLVIFENRGSKSINQAAPIELFFELTRSIEHLALAQYLCEIALTLIGEQEQSGEALRTMLNALHLLCKNDRPPALIKSAVELRMMCLAGFMPDLLMCRGCGAYEHERMFFLPQTGSLSCADCFKGNEAGIELSPSALTAMRHIALSPVGKIFSFKINEQSLGMLAQAAESYLLCKTEKRFAALEFYQSVAI